MSLKPLVRTDIATVLPGASVRDAARMMEERNVGSVVVTEGGRPVGILTDRDILVRVVNRQRDVANVPVSDVMTRDPYMLAEDMDLSEALEFVRDKAIRRFPVVDLNGHLRGFFTVDDVLRLVGKEMNAVASILEKETAPA
jgi:CBS domain-containing protein